MLGILERHVARQAGAPAIIGQSVSLTYQEILERVTACAALLLRQGLAPGHVVGVAVTDEIDHLVCAMALLCLGTPQVCLASHESAVRKSAIMNKLGVTQLIADRGEPWHADARLFAPRETGHTMSSGPAPDPAALRCTLAPDAVMLYQNTSGSTYVPKTFGLTWLRLLVAAQRQITGPHEQRVLRTTSMEHDATRYHRISALIAGRVCVFSQRFDLETIAALCERAEVTEIHIGTYKLASLLASQRDARRLPSFTHILTGGSRVPGPLREAVIRRLTDNLWVNYATSEMGRISLASPDQHQAHPDGIGFPVDGTIVEIVDMNGKRLPPGDIGQARIRKIAVPDRYVADPAASSVFREGWFYPGDMLSATENGLLTFHGRADDMMILNGINIFPSAIEDTLQAHADVHEAVAYGIASRIHGQIPVAAVVLRPGSERQDPSRLLDYCRTILGLRAPRQILVVDRIPRNSSGKPLRNELARDALRQRK